jgi:hypothetical protein
MKRLFLILGAAALLCGCEGTGSYYSTSGHSSGSYGDPLSIDGALAQMEKTSLESQINEAKWAADEAKRAADDAKSENDRLNSELEQMRSEINR